MRYPSWKYIAVTVSALNTVWNRRFMRLQNICSPFFTVHSTLLSNALLPARHVTSRSLTTSSIMLPDLDNNIRKREMNIAKVSEIIEWGCRNMGLLTENGFVIPLDLKSELLGEALLIEDDKL